MADPKKPEAKGGGDDTFNKMIFALLGLYFLWIVIERINTLLVMSGAGTYGDIWDTIVAGFFQNVWPVVKIIALIISVSAMYGITVIYKKFVALRKEENILFGVKADSQVSLKTPDPVNEKWRQIENHINSKNPSEWRLAIIEADIMLDDLLKTMGYHGDTVGDRLKAVEKSDFTTLDSAWEAHKVRNSIAHQGADFDLNEREARRVIALFEVVFREFKII